MTIARRVLGLVLVIWPLAGLIYLLGQFLGWGVIIWLVVILAAVSSIAAGIELL